MCTQASPPFPAADLGAKTSLSLSLVSVIRMNEFHRGTSRCFPPFKKTFKSQESETAPSRTRKADGAWKEMNPPHDRTASPETQEKGDSFLDFVSASEGEG